MKNQRDKLHQYQKRITVITTRETDIAKQCLQKGDKKKALVALRRKKYQETLLEKTDAQLAQLEALTNDVEFAQVQKDVLFGLKQGTAVLKEIHKEMGGVDAVERLLGETADAQAYTQEVSELLAGKMSNQDEDDVEDELEALEIEMSGMKLPNVPSQELQKVEAVEQETKEEKAKRRRLERAAEQTSQPMLA
ncbi:charged multivesicular body protein-like protein 6 [Pseudovirgaria hyperparasitica]|uniref:Charged multivesicular body protein-like protein 6 n=1 Tax=Pseudovirgaria hyperparasitica TaxID=470096 RepID=A0A6A6VVW4_9PEZI|nr:charged multivesicular body protein-like protein 6 [Pseudovirgaria hyperparasitica]KAF2753854.1 charged multivesicular body protein-like protein 6 [Pseudovirgaria hyperparasitica]